MEEVSINLDNQEQTTLQEIKDHLVEEVKVELQNKGYEVIPQGYEGQKDLVKLVDKANQLKVAYEQECERIKNRYKDDVAKQKINVLTVDYELDKKDLLAEVDQVLEKDAKYRADSIERLQKSEEYKANKKECFEMLKLLQGTEIPYQMVEQIIIPLVGAKDTFALDVAKLLVGSNTTNAYLIDTAINSINAYQQNNELVNFANTAKEFISSGKDSLTLFAYMKNYS